MRNILHISLLLFIISACKAQAPAAQNSSECDLLVSFSSRGSGINHTAARNLEKYLASHSWGREKPAIDTIRWGREGETDYCMRLKDKDQRNAFVKGIRELLKEQAQVSVETNKTPAHKR